MSGLARALDAPLARSRPRIDAAARALTGGRCTGCGAASWPTKAVCPACGSADIVDEVFPTDGVLESWTRVWTPVAGVEAPYLLGLVRVGPVAVFGHLRAADEPAVVPCPVRLVVDVDAVPPFWFEPS